MRQIAVLSHCLEVVWCCSRKWVDARRLLGDHVGMMVLVPADVLRPRRPDAHFEAEVVAARDAGLEVAVIDHDALARGGAPGMAVARVPAGGDAVYRGWMLRPEQYAAMAEALSARGVLLRTDAVQYRRAHELPGWCADVAAVTPESVWTVGDGRAAFEQARLALQAGPAVLRDYTKSMKHYWHEAAFIPDLADANAAWRVAARFRELRADDFVGGFVLRRFESFTGAEVRTWWVNGACRLVTAHPDTPNDHPPGDLDLTGIAPLIKRLNLPFVTVDLALRADGQWRVVEIGDGQVSDYPTTAPASALITALNLNHG